MKKNTYLIITFGCMMTFNVFCSYVDFIKIIDAPYYVQEQDNLNDLQIFYLNQMIEISTKKFSIPRRSNRSSAKPSYISTDDLYIKILEKISPDNPNKNIEINAIGQGQEAEIKKGFYYNLRCLYNKTLFVKNKNENNE